MNRFLALVSCLFLITVACSATGCGFPSPKPPGFAPGEPAAAARSVPADQIGRFLEIVASGNYDEMKGAGEMIFTVGSVIPDHAVLFRDFSPRRVDDGTIRYLLFLVCGVSDFTMVSMSVKSASGEIVGFDCFEFLGFRQ